MLNENERKLLKQIAESSGPMIENSGIFLTLLSGSYVDSIAMLVQLSIAIVLDKPIALLVLRGAKVPEHIKKIAFAIEYVDSTDMTDGKVEAATKRILEKAGVLKKGTLKK